MSSYQSASAMMLQRTQAQLVQSQKITALGQLVASVAHDLNNPLTAVIGYTEILLRQATDATQRRRLELISRESQRAASIVRNLLTFSRQRSQEKVPLNINDVIQAAVHLRVEQAKTGIQIISDLAPELPIVIADFYQIQQVILNLVLNAEQAILQTEQRGRIEIRTQRVPAHTPNMPEQIKITVADNGPGMPPAVRERIFEPFFTTKKEGKGTGLGLSICKNIVDSHDGTIDVESTVGEGTCFFILLPVPPVTNNPLKSAPEPEVKPPTSAVILVVDDEALIREMLRSGLEEQGYHVETASNGMEALKKIREGCYHLVLTDIYMPELDGISLHQQLQQDTNFHAKFILMTGNHTSDQSVLRSVPDTVPCLLKPFQLEDVLQKIREVLQ